MKNWTKRLAAAALAVSVSVSALQAGALALTPAQKLSEAYGESVYCQRLEQVNLTGDYRTDLVNVALSQIGYHEGDEDADYHGGNTAGWHNHTEYGSIYGGLDAQWCAMFVSWCARQAEIPKYLINNAARAAVDGRTGTGRFWFHMNYYKKDKWEPAAGDLIFFSGDGRYTSHVGIVVEVTDSGLYTVEGNSQDAVRLHYYERDDDYIHGYAVYAEKPETDLRTELNVFTVDFSCSGGSNGTMPDGDPYAFQRLHAVEGREFTLPAGAFQMEECELLGYYASRTEGETTRWYCGEQGWLSLSEMERGKLAPERIPDGASWCFEGSWTETESICLHGILASAYGSTMYDGQIPDRFKADGQGWINPFLDVGESSWYYDAVRRGHELDIVTAEYGSRFAGDGEASRGQFVTMLYRAAGSPVVGSDAPAFDDVPEDHWAYESVRWAREAGVTQGVDGNLFAPDETMSREQMVTLLHRWQGEAAALDLDFPDADSVSDWAQEAMEWAVEKGLITGMATEEGEILLSPLSAASRAQALTLTLRLMDESGR